MLDKKAMRRAEEDKRRGKSAGTQAGEFVRDEIDKIRWSARSAIGKAGDCDWIVDGAAGGGESPAAEARKNIGADAAECGAGVGNRAGEAEGASAIGEAVAGDREGAETRGAERGVA